MKVVKVLISGSTFGSQLLKKESQHENLKYYSMIKKHHLLIVPMDEKYQSSRKVGTNTMYLIYTAISYNVHTYT